MLTEAHVTQTSITFDGLKAPVLLNDADSLLPTIRAVLPSWNFSTHCADPAVVPSAVLTNVGNNIYRCQLRDPAEPARRWDAVNAVCEMIVALAWEQIEANPSWLCLHCAAVEIDGRLVLFPNRRRSGKSTLTAVLAHRGYRVFTDDFLPVQIDSNGYMNGFANGIAMRIRQPLPAEFSETFQEWAIRTTVTANKQYAYLSPKTLAARGETLPIGAIVVLDRTDTYDLAELSPVSEADVLDDLVTQNFARITHSGRILQASYGVARSAQRFRLTYSSAEAAADQLERALVGTQAQLLPVPELHEMPAEVDLGTVDTALLPAFDNSTSFHRVPHFTEVGLGDQHYVADAYGVGIHRMNPGSRVIWTILEEPASLSEICSILSAAFPETSVEQISQDAEATLQQFMECHLIQPVDRNSGMTE
ncbi:Coenzyme PQQ synthesis protein D (PqqD) [Cognatiyoonia koreensis]|uniref:Coenzyme PQQ synthesis protein D (PqqD) n=1 Tax=Cognatiyoonia koreensis TaxID=364200 RepID=A0A1I0PCZ6_9RHOB|nr:PqqD family protein [Cognatiyoonia koreensis]SEW11473.1 Coenzyme PQQ synthesis protein D (PqqD) [Cognatiyoonia koreensis]